MAIWLIVGFIIFGASASNAMEPIGHRLKPGSTIKCENLGGKCHQYQYSSGLIIKSIKGVEPITEKEIEVPVTCPKYTQCTIPKTKFKEGKTLSREEK